MAEVVRYYRTGRGVLGEVTESHAEVTKLPAGAAEITREEYEQQAAQLAGDREQRHAAIRQAEAERAQGDVAALVAAGVPETTARRLAGVRERD